MATDSICGMTHDQGAGIVWPEILVRHFHGWARCGTILPCESSLSNLPATATAARRQASDFHHVRRNADDRG